MCIVCKFRVKYPVYDRNPFKVVACYRADKKQDRQIDKRADGNK